MRCIYLIALFVLSNSVFNALDAIGQPSVGALQGEEGDPCIEHFSTKALGFDVANWSCVRDKRGILWAGNSYGLLEFDGHSWRLHSSPNDTPVYDVVCGEDGTVYFGLRGAFGRVVFSSTGHPEMELLSKELPPDAPMLTEFYRIHIIDTVVYFVSEEAICQWDGSRCSVIESEYPLGRSYKAGGRIYVNTDETGLCILKRGRIVPLPGGELFSARAGGNGPMDIPDNIICLYQDGDGSLIVGSRYRGIFRYDGSTFHNEYTFESITDPLWMPTHSVPLANDLLAVGTTHSGVWILDNTGAVRAVLDKDIGLKCSAVNDLYVDVDQTIWASLDDGITRIEWPGEPLSRFGSERGIFGQVSALCRFAGSMYAATTQGLYMLQSDPSLSRRSDARRATFLLLPNIRSGIFSILNVGSELLVGTSSGLYAMSPTHSFRRISSPQRGTRALLRVHGSNDTILVGSHNGLYLVIRNGGTWTEQVLSDKKGDFILSLTETADGMIWAGTAQDGVRRIDLRNGALRAVLQRYDTAQGLADGPNIVTAVQNRIFVINNVYPLAFDAARAKFYPDTLFLQRFDAPLRDAPMYLSQDDQGRIWMQFFGEETLEYVRLRESDNLYASVAPFLRVQGEVITMFGEDNGICWIGTENSVLRFDSRSARRTYHPFSTLLRKVSVDAVGVYYGSLASEKALELPCDACNIVFECASGNISLHDCVLFRWRLDGLDTAWSSPGPLHSMHYTNLPPGEYRFRVQAVIPGHFTAREAGFSFIIPEPLYFRTWFLLSLLAVLLILVIYVVTRRRRVDIPPANA